MNSSLHYKIIIKRFKLITPNYRIFNNNLLTIIEPVNYYCLVFIKIKIL